MEPSRRDTPKATTSKIFFISLLSNPYSSSPPKTTPGGVEGSVRRAARLDYCRLTRAGVRLNAGIVQPSLAHSPARYEDLERRPGGSASAEPPMQRVEVGLCSHDGCAIAEPGPRACCCRGRPLRRPYPPAWTSSSHAGTRWIHETAEPLTLTAMCGALNVKPVNTADLAAACSSQPCGS